MLTLEKFRAIEADYAAARMHYVAARAAHSSEKSKNFEAHGPRDAGSFDPIFRHLGNVLRDLDTHLFAHKPLRGAKSARVESVIHAMTEDFSCAGLSRLCPGVSRDLVRRVMRKMKRAGVLQCAGRGTAARWRVTRSGE